VSTPQGGTPPYSVYLSDDQNDEFEMNNLSAGTYFLTIADANQCNAGAEITLTEPETLSAFVVPAQEGMQAFALGGTLPYSFFWNEEEGTAFSGPLAPGEHELKVIDWHACEIEIEMQIDIPENVIYLEFSEECLLQSRQQLLWKCGRSVRMMQLFDGAGRCIAMERGCTISLESLAPGVYIASVETDSGQLIRQKIRVMH